MSLGNYICFFICFFSIFIKSTILFDFLLEGVLVTQSQSDFRYLVGEIQIKLVNSLKLFFKVLIVENELELE